MGLEWWNGGVEVGSRWGRGGGKARERWVTGPPGGGEKPPRWGGDTLPRPLCVDFRL